MDSPFADGVLCHSCLRPLPKGPKIHIRDESTKLSPQDWFAIRCAVDDVLCNRIESTEYPSNEMKKQKLRITEFLKQQHHKALLEETEALKVNSKT